jgi:hypothetical protein
VSERLDVDKAKTYLNQRFGFTGERLEWEACFLAGHLNMASHQDIDLALKQHELAPLNGVDEAHRLNAAARAMYLGLKSIAFGTVREAGEVARETLDLAAEKLSGK